MLKVYKFCWKNKNHCKVRGGEYVRKRRIEESRAGFVEKATFSKDLKEMKHCRNAVRFLYKRSLVTMISAYRIKWL